MPYRQSEAPVGLLAIHSQSNRKDAPLDFTDPSEQAFDSRALSLPNVDIVVMNAPLEPVYADYYTHVLGLSLPTIITPRRLGNSLSESLGQDSDALRKVHDAQKAVGKPVVLSVFDPTDNERKLKEDLHNAEVSIISEVDYTVAEKLGNKAGFREFCRKYGIPQLPGGVFKRIEDLLSFISRTKQGTIIKHPFGTAGEGMSKIPANGSPTEEHIHKWQEWIKGAGAIVGEMLHPKVGEGTEHALHIYIDPLTKEAQVTGVYDQLTSQSSEGTLSHYGARFPMQNKRVEKKLLRLAHKKIIPALLKEGYKGPACFDVLSQPLHFMELNTRAGANFYAHRSVEKVADRLYERTGQEAFMFLASLDAPQGETSFAEFYAKYHDVLEPQYNGTLIFTNPGRHAFGKYDVIAFSPYGAQEAEKVLREGITAIWGEAKAAEYFAKIHQGRK